MEDAIWWYMSFYDDEANKWLGATCVEAKDQLGAMNKSEEMGCNPGGEALIIQCDEPPPEAARYKLFDLETAKKLFGPMGKVKRG
jgi:hypothetical protein